MDGLRRAALALSALSRRDREWMLSQLAPAQRARLGPLVDELCALGLEAEPGLHDRLREEEARRCAESLAAGDERLAQAIVNLDGCPADLMARHLAGEPDVVLAALLARFPWRWAADALARLPDARRMRVEDLKPVVHGMQPAPWRALVLATAARCGAGAGGGQ